MANKEKSVYYLDKSTLQSVELVTEENKKKFISSNVGRIDNWAFNIQPWVWDLLKKHFREIFTEEDIINFNEDNEKRK